MLHGTMQETQDTKAIQSSSHHASVTRLQAVSRPPKHFPQPYTLVLLSD